MERYWISMKVEEGWSPWKEVSRTKYLWALDRWDYTTRITQQDAP